MFSSPNSRGLGGWAVLGDGRGAISLNDFELSDLGHCRLKQFFLHIPGQIGPQPNCRLALQSFEIAGRVARFPSSSQQIVRTAFQTQTPPDLLIGIVTLLPGQEDIERQC